VSAILFSAEMVASDGDSGRRAVSRRLAKMNQSQPGAFGDDEESPLQSKRSSTLVYKPMGTNHALYIVFICVVPM